LREGILVLRIEGWEFLLGLRGRIFVRRIEVGNSCFED